MLTLIDLIGLWLEQCEAEGKTVATVRSYREALKNYARFSSDIPTEADVYRYMAAMRRRGNSAGTIRNRLATLRVFCHWLVDCGRISEDPMVRIALPRPDRKVLSYTTPDQIRAMLKHADLREAAIILLLFNTGVRVSELVSMELDDIDFYTLTATVHGKGRKDRVVYIGKRPRKALLDYVAVRGDQPGPLFLNRSGKRLRRESITQLLHKLSRKSRIPKCSPHALRRAFAMAYLRGGGDPFRLQLLMGHEDLDMTRRYAAALRDEDAIRQAREVSPADRL